MQLIPITNDLYDVAARLRAVDEDYRLYYNVGSRRFEVHSALRGTMQFVVPFDELDARTVDYARATRVQNAERIFRELERHNAQLQQQAVQNAENALKSASQ